MAFLAAVPLAGWLSAGLGAVGALTSGFAAYSAGNYSNKVAEMNAKVAEANALRSKNAASVEAQQQDALTLGMLGEQEASQSASGLSVTGKSQVLTRKAAARLGRLDALNITRAGEIEAYNHKVDAANMLAQGQQAKASGAGSLLGGFLGAASSLIGGSTSTTAAKRVQGGSSTYDPWVTRRGTSMRAVA